MWAPERIERPTASRVLLDHGLDDLLGRLVQAGVDHLHAGVAQRAGDDLGAAVVPVEAGLGHDDADLAPDSGLSAAVSVVACINRGASARGPREGAAEPSGRNSTGPGQLWTGSRAAACPRRAALRRTFLSNLPTLVFGTSSMKANSSGIHHFATCGGEVLAQLLRRAGRPLARAPRRPAAARSSARRASRSPPPRARRVGHQLVLELDRRDPLAAGLDHVLGAVGDPACSPAGRSRRCRRCAASRRRTSRRRTGRCSSRTRSRGRGSRSRPSTRRPTAASPSSSPISRTSTQRHDPAGRGPVAPVRPRPRRPRGGRATAPSGLVSVMPQAWMIFTPWRSSKPRISDSGTAAPPQTTVRRLERSGLCSSA